MSKLLTEPEFYTSYVGNSALYEHRQDGLKKIAKVSNFKDAVPESSYLNDVDVKTITDETVLSKTITNKDILSANIYAKYNTTPNIISKFFFADQSFYDKYSLIITDLDVRNNKLLDAISYKIDNNDITNNILLTQLTSNQSLSIASVKNNNFTILILNKIPNANYNTLYIYGYPDPDSQTSEITNLYLKVTPTITEIFNNSQYYITGYDREWIITYTLKIYSDINCTTLARYNGDTNLKVSFAPFITNTTKNMIITEPDAYEIVLSNNSQTNTMSNYTFVGYNNPNSDPGTPQTLINEPTVNISISDIDPSEDTIRKIKYYGVNYNDSNNTNTLSNNIHEISESATPVTPEIKYIDTINLYMYNQVFHINTN